MFRPGPDLRKTAPTQATDRIGGPNATLADPELLGPRRPRHRGVPRRRAQDILITNGKITSITPRPRRPRLVSWNPRRHRPPRRPWPDQRPHAQPDGHDARRRRGPLDQQLVQPAHLADGGEPHPGPSQRRRPPGLCRDAPGRRDHVRRPLLPRRPDRPGRPESGIRADLAPTYFSSTGPEGIEAAFDTTRDLAALHPRDHRQPRPACHVHGLRTRPPPHAQISPAPRIPDPPPRRRNRRPNQASPDQTRRHPDRNPRPHRHPRRRRPHRPRLRPPSTTDLRSSPATPTAPRSPPAPRST